MKIFTVLLCIVIIFITSCSMDYREGTIAEDLSEDIPNSVLFDVTHTIVRGGNPVYIVHAKKAASYHSKNSTIMYNVLFQELNKEGEIVTEGWVDHIVFHTDTENAELSENIEFYSSAEEAEIRADYLEWNNELRTLSGKPDGEVFLEDTAGSTVNGSGFTADFSKKRIDFSGTVEGTYVDEDNED